MKNIEEANTTIGATNRSSIRHDTKKKYSKPELTFRGDIRDVTLGGSFGSGESGAPTVFKDIR
jgi:hypothetical protein